MNSKNVCMMQIGCWFLLGHKTVVVLTNRLIGFYHPLFHALCNRFDSNLFLLLVLFQMCSRNLAISVALFLALVPLINSLPQHSIAKRSTFFEIECKGVFNKSIFYRLDRICEDCYSLFREPELHSLCK